MRLTKYRHSCLLVEDGTTRLLLDPGTFSQGFEHLDDLTAIAFTHQHPDHFDPEKVAPLLEANPRAEVVADEGTAAKLQELGAAVHVVRDGDRFDLGGTSIRVHGTTHAVIHPDIPVIPNVGYLIGGRFFHPGDAFTVPGAPVEVLGLPTAAPWLKASEAIEYLRAVKPKRVVPIHEAVVAATGLYYGLYERFGNEQDTTFSNLDDGRPVEL